MSTSLLSAVTSTTVGTAAGPLASSPSEGFLLSISANGPFIVTVVLETSPDNVTWTQTYIQTVSAVNLYTNTINQDVPTGYYVRGRAYGYSGNSTSVSLSFNQASYPTPIATYATDPSGNVTGLVSPSGNTLITPDTDNTKLYKFRAALARQQTGGAFCKVAFIGDSTTAGGISSGTVNQYRINSFPSVLATLLSNAGYPSASSNAFGNGAAASGVGQTYGIWDSRLSGTGSWVLQPSNFLGVGGNLLGTASASAGTLTFTPGISTDSCDIYYYDQAGVFTVNVNGGATITTVTGTSTSTIKKTTVTFTAGVNVINLVWVSGGINIGGFDAYTSTTPQIHLLNFGSNGATASSLSTNASGYAPPNWYTFIASDLTIISLGINDWSTSVSVSSYTNALQSLITLASVSGDVILMSPFPSALSVSTNQAAYVTAMRGLAQTNNIKFIDENYNLVDKVTMTARGLGSDTLHPNGIGHAVIARDVMKALEFAL